MHFKKQILVAVAALLFLNTTASARKIMLGTDSVNCAHVIKGDTIVTPDDGGILADYTILEDAGMVPIEGKRSGGGVQYIVNPKPKNGFSPWGRQCIAIQYTYNKWRNYYFFLT